MAKLIFQYLYSKKRYEIVKIKTKERERKISSVKEKNVTKPLLNKQRSAKRKKSRVRSLVGEC